MKRRMGTWSGRIGAALVLAAVSCGLIYGGSYREGAATFRPMGLFSFFDGWFGVRTDASEKLWEDALVKLDEVENLHLEAFYESYLCEGEDVSERLILRSQSSADLRFDPYRAQGTRSSSWTDPQSGDLATAYDLFCEEPLGEHTNAYRFLSIGHSGTLFDDQAVPEVRAFRLDDPVHPQLLSWLRDALGSLTELSVEGTEIVGSGEAIHLSGRLPEEAVVELVAQEIALPPAIEAKLRDRSVALPSLRLHFWVDNFSGHISKLELNLDEIYREVYEILLADETLPLEFSDTYAAMETMRVRVTFRMQDVNQLPWFDNSSLLDRYAAPVQEP